MKRQAVLLLFLILAAGCAKVKQIQHLDPLLTLKSYSDEKEEQAKWIDEEVKRFETLLLAVTDKTIDPQLTKDSVRQAFGEPVVADVIEENNTTVERWLYRHPIQKLASDRVYIYFSAEGRMIRYEHVVPVSHEQS